MKPVVIWAIDPFQAKNRPDPKVLQEFFDWMTVAGFEVQPIHILAYSTARESVERYLEVADHLVPEAEQAVDAYLEELGVADFKNLLPSKIVSAPGKSLKREIQKILLLSEAANSPMIVVNSHGSFAEAILLDSPCPVFILSASHASFTEAPARVLFPTDFSKSSHEAFEEFLPQLRLLNAEIILFHGITIPSFALAPGVYGTGDIGIPSHYFAEMVSWSKDEGNLWLAHAKDHGLRARLYLVDEGIAGDLAQAILRSASEMRVRMIALASKNGHVAREIFRSRAYPIWIWGPKATSSGSLAISDSA